jgi:hypothetical protein
VGIIVAAQLVEHHVDTAELPRLSHRVVVQRLLRTRRYLSLAELPRLAHRVVAQRLP